MQDVLSLDFFRRMVERASKEVEENDLNAAEERLLSLVALIQSWRRNLLR